MTDRRTLGSSDLSVSPLCLGANVFSWNADEKATLDILDAYVAGAARLPLPVTDRLADEVLAIPVHPLLSSDDLATIVEAVRAVATPRERA